MAFAKWISSKWWPIAVGFCLAAVAYIRFAEAGDCARRHWTRVQSEEMAVAEQEPQMRYFCIGDMAFDMGGDNESFELFEDKIVISDSRAKKLCFPPWAGVADRDAVLMSATSESGWGSTLINADKPMRSALEETKKRLEHLGWMETPYSAVALQRSESLQGAMFEKGGSWVLMSGFYNADEHSTDILLAGRFEP